VVVLGGPGADTLYCGVGTCTLDGGDNNDIITHLGAGSALGRGGNDTFENLGTASVQGGSGDDTIKPGVQTPLVDGGDGNDFIDYRAGGAPTPFRVVPATGATPGFVMTDSRQIVVNRVERARLRGASVEQFVLTMSPFTAFQYTPPGNQNATAKVKVPGGVWTVAGGMVTAPGLQPVTGLPANTVVVAA
jgi:hypothetical protein